MVSVKDGSDGVRRRNLAAVLTRVHRGGGPPTFDPTPWFDVDVQGWDSTGMTKWHHFVMPSKNIRTKANKWASGHIQG